MTAWTFIFLMVILKIPIAMLLYIVWWAVKQTPDEPAGGAGDSGGSRPPHPRYRRPRGPRRGPHGSPAPGPPPRVRAVVAHGSRAHGH